MESTEYRIDLRKNVVSGVRWTAGARILGKFISWCITILVMRLLSPQDYGLMAIATIFIIFLLQLHELGLGAILVQKKDLDETTIRQVLAVLLLINFGFAILLLLSAHLIGNFFKEPRIVPLIRLFSIVFIIIPYSIVPSSLLERELRFRSKSIIDFISTLTGSLTTLILALSGFGVWSLAWGELSIHVSRTIGLNFFCSRLRTPSFNFKGIKEIIPFSSYMTIYRILWFIFSQADIFFVGKLLGKQLLGFYSVAMNFATLPMEKISVVFNQVALSAFARIQTDRVKVAAHFLKAIRVVSFMSFPLMWGISCIAPELVAILLGDKWQMVALPLQLLTIVVPLRMIVNLMNPAVIGVGRPDISLFNVLVASVLVPLGVIIGVHWGIVGVCIAWVIAFPVVFLANLWRVSTVLGVKPIDVLSAMASPALAGAAMAGGVIAAKVVFGTNPKSIPQLALLIAIGAIAYGIIALTANRKGYREVLDLVKA